MIRRALAPLAILLFVALPSSAWAAPKVAVTAIDGDTEGEVRDAVIEAIDGDELKVVGKKETNRAADKIGDLSELTEKNAKKLAKELSADAIVTGALEKDGGTRTLKIKLFVNGKMKKGFSVKFKKVSSKFKAALRKKLTEKLEGTTEMAAAEEETPKKPKQPAKTEIDDEDPLAKVKPKKGDKGDKPDRTAKAGKPGKGEKAAKGEPAEEPEQGPEKRGDAAAPDEGEQAAAPEEDADKAAEPADKGEQAAGADDDDAPVPKKKKRTAALDEDEDDPSISRRAEPERRGRSANRAAARLDVGPSMVKRSLTFNSNLPANQAPRPFQPGPVPGVRVEGDLYPLAFSTDGVLSALGIAFKLDRTLKMTLGTSAEMGVEIPAEQFHYAAGARIRIVGKSPTSPSVTLGMDIGRSRFRPDRSVLANPDNLDLPDTYYRFMAPGLAFRIPIGGMLAFFARGEGWLVSDAGMIVRSYSYGRAKVLGFDAEGGFDIVLARRFAIRLAGGFTQIGYDFTGVGGAQANARDGDPSTLDVGGAADRALNAAMTLAVMY